MDRIEMILVLLRIHFSLYQIKQLVKQPIGVLTPIKKIKLSINQINHLKHSKHKDILIIQDCLLLEIITILQQQ